MLILAGGREKRLVQRIRAGDRAASEQFVHERYDRVYSLLRHLCGCPETSSDLAQQTFVRAWQSLDTFRGESSLGTWLHRIAYHEYLHWRRDRREHALLDQLPEMADRKASAPWEAVLLRGALDELSPEQRDAFLLRHVSGLSVAEVAVLQNVPPGTVKSRLFAARQRLRALLLQSSTATTTAAPAASTERLAAYDQPGGTS